MRPHPVFFVLVVGCSNDRPQATSDGADYVSVTSDRCPIEGQTRDCHFVINQTPLYTDCIIGTQKCGPDLRWGACERPDFVVKSTPPSNGPSADATFAGAPASDDSSCPVDAPALDGPLVEVVAVGGARPPPEGGEVLPGAYVLTSSETFTGDVSPGPTGTIVQRAVVVTADHLALREGSGSASSGIDETSTQVLWFGTNGTAFGYEPTCPRTKRVVAIEYSAHGNELVLFPSAQQRDVLTRKP